MPHVRRMKTPQNAKYFSPDNTLVKIIQRGRVPHSPFHSSRRRVLTSLKASADGWSKSKDL